MSNRWHTFRQWAPVITGGILAAIFIGLFTSAVNRSADQSAQNGQILSILQDCLTPGGKCYEAALANQAHLIEQITRRDVYVTLCSMTAKPTVPAQLECVGSLIKEFGNG